MIKDSLEFLKSRTDKQIETLQIEINEKHTHNNAD